MKNAALQPPSEPAKRLFIGLMPGREVQAAIQQHCRLWVWPSGCKPTSPERLHLTLHFLGNLDAAREKALKNALLDVPVEPLELVLQIPRVLRNEVAILQPQEHAGLRALRQRLGSALACIGMAFPQHWKPHVTLARKAARAVAPEAPPRIPWRVTEFVLVWSKLSQPPCYEVLARYRRAAVRGVSSRN